MFQRILVPLDGSEQSLRAVPVAARIARVSGGTIIFVNVVLPPVEFGTYSAEHTVALKPGAFERRKAEATRYLRDVTITHANDLAGIATEMDVTSGAASPEIDAAARLEHVDLIVVCSHGETGLKRWVFGSVTQELVRHSPVPVLVLHEQGVGFLAPSASHLFRMLVPLDGSALSETALLSAAQLMAVLAAPAQGVLHLLRVVDLPPAYGQMKSQANVTEGMLEEAGQEAAKYVKSVADRLREGPFAAFKLTITSSVAVSTDVAGAIIEKAERSGIAESSAGYDMIAMSTHGRGGLQRLLMGSTAERVLGTTKLPLLIVRPQGK